MAEQTVRWLGINWTPAMIAALRILLDRCEPHGNIKPCIHCTHNAAIDDQEGR